MTLSRGKKRTVLLVKRKSIKTAAFQKLGYFNFVKRSNSTERVNHEPPYKGVNSKSNFVEGILAKGEIL